MTKNKRHISVGLPGRLSINGFGDFEAGIGIHRWSGLFLLASAMLLVVATTLYLLRPDFSRALLAQSPWAWPIAGVVLAFAASPRPRIVTLLVIALWIGFGVYFAAEPRTGHEAADARAVSRGEAVRQASP